MRDRRPGSFLADFGLARDTTTGSRFTRTGQTLGTPSYMSPEQARGELAALAPASDVWSLGCVLYEAVAGRRAFEGSAPSDVAAAVLLREPVRLHAIRPDVPRALERVVRACLSKRPDLRPPDAAALRDDGARVLRGERPRARPPDRPLRAATWAACALAGAAGAVWVVVPRGAPANTAPRSRLAAQATALARRAHALRQSDPREAARLLGDALSLSPPEAPPDPAAPARWRLERGLLLWAVGENADARAEWDRIPPGGPEAARARLYRGLEAFVRLRGNEAAPDLEAVAAGTGPDARLARSAVAALRRQWASARSALDGANGWEAALLRGYIEDADPAGDPAAALHAYDAALADGIAFAWVHINRGALRGARGDHAGEIADCDRALALDPRNMTAHHNRGIARNELGDLPGAIADLDRVIAANPRDAAALHVRGDAKQRRGDVDGAIADYDRAIALKPERSRVYNSRGNARLARGDLADARADYDRAIALDPGNAAPYACRAGLRAEQGDLAGGIADFERALVVAPPDWPYRREVEDTLARVRTALAARGGS